jgi:hypothetical protein
MRQIKYRVIVIFIDGELQEPANWKTQKLDEGVSLVLRQGERRRVVRLDDGERKTVELSRVERQARLFEAISDTTRTSEERVGRRNIANFYPPETNRDD